MFLSKKHINNFLLNNFHESSLKNCLKPVQFKKIKFCTIFIGNSLEDNSWGNSSRISSSLKKKFKEFWWKLYKRLFHSKRIKKIFGRIFMEAFQENFWKNFKIEQIRTYFFVISMESLKEILQKNVH